MTDSDRPVEPHSRAGGRNSKADPEEELWCLQLRAGSFEEGGGRELGRSAVFFCVFKAAQPLSSAKTGATAQGGRMQPYSQTSHTASELCEDRGQPRGRPQPFLVGEECSLSNQSQPHSL
uniref:Uncharacterized protein n=1 Tax=Oryzias latipes TaxID=8090 RepID=A0A286TFM6_ORYLA|nr:hypothetical protein [Oryzias latipes]BBA49163.1 hypothetical protein [Oryzias latipes]